MPEYLAGTIRESRGKELEQSLAKRQLSTVSSQRTQIAISIESIGFVEHFEPTKFSQSEVLKQAWRPNKGPRSSRFLQHQHNDALYSELMSSNACSPMV